MLRRHLPALALAALIPLASCNRKPVPGIARGEALFVTCGKCHGDNGEGDQRLAAPAIGGLPAWYVEAQLAGFMQAHRGYDPFDTTGIRMKSVAWTLDRDGDIASVAEYVASLNPGRAPATLRADATAGAAAFQTCAACHGANAEGNQDLHAPPLAGRSDWYLLSQLQKFKRGWRGARSDDLWGQTMRAQAMALDDSAMHNVIAYIATLGAEAAAR